MSYYIDKEEFYKAVERKDWEFIWSAYRYAVDSVEERTTAGKQLEELRELRSTIERANEYDDRTPDEVAGWMHELLDILITRSADHTCEGGIQQYLNCPKCNPYK
jgi:hypothetical protein